MQVVATIPPRAIAAIIGSFVFIACGTVYLVAAIRDWDGLRGMGQWHRRYADNSRFSFASLGVLLILVGAFGLLGSIVVWML